MNRINKFMPEPNDYIIRLPEVKKITGLSRSSIYMQIADKRFPRQIPLGKRAVGWLKSEVGNWLMVQKAQSINSAGGNDE